jgi:hypothetical protein
MGKRISYQYYVVMEDLGKLGLEAVVTPETTRRAVVEFIKNGNYRNIVFIHHVDGLYICDCTSELIDEAEAQLKAEFLERRATQQAYEFDRARNLRNEVA